MLLQCEGVCLGQKTFLTMPVCLLRGPRVYSALPWMKATMSMSPSLSTCEGNKCDTCQTRCPALGRAEWDWFATFSKALLLLAGALRKALEILVTDVSFINGVGEWHFAKMLSYSSFFSWGNKVHSWSWPNELKECSPQQHRMRTFWFQNFVGKCCVLRYLFRTRALKEFCKTSLGERRNQFIWSLILKFKNVCLIFI
jgi:hypothetical protein